MMPKLLKPRSLNMVVECQTVESTPPINVVGAARATPFGLGLYLDIPVGQDIFSSGSRRIPASAWPSVSHGIVEDQSELLSGFAIAGDGQSESTVEYEDEFSETYKDDDDPRYHRQPIEDEEWFLAHEADCPSDGEQARPNVENPRGSRREKDQEKYEDEDRSFVEEVAHATRILDGGPFNRQLMRADGLPLMCGDARWQGFEVCKCSHADKAGSKKLGRGRSLSVDGIFEVDSAQFSGGAGVSDVDSERRESMHGESSEENLDIGEIGVRSAGQTSSSSQDSDSGRVHNSESVRKQDEEEEEDLILKHNNPWPSHKRQCVGWETSTLDTLQLSSLSTSAGEVGSVSRVDSGKSMWSVRDITGQVLGEGAEEYGNGVLGSDDPLASWRRNASSPIIRFAKTVVQDDEARESVGEPEQAPEEDLAEVGQQIREAEAVVAEDEENTAAQDRTLTDDVSAVPTLILGLSAGATISTSAPAGATFTVPAVGEGTRVGLTPTRASSYSVRFISTSGKVFEVPVGRESKPMVKNTAKTKHSLVNEIFNIQITGGKWKSRSRLATAVKPIARLQDYVEFVNYSQGLNDRDGFVVDRAAFTSNWPPINDDIQDDM